MSMVEMDGQIDALICQQMGRFGLVRVIVSKARAGRFHMLRSLLDDRLLVPTYWPEAINPLYRQSKGTTMTYRVNRVLLVE